MSYASMQVWDVGTPREAFITLEEGVVIRAISLHIIKLAALDGDLTMRLVNDSTEEVLGEATVSYIDLEAAANADEYHGLVWFDFGGLPAPAPDYMVMRIELETACSVGKIGLIKDHEMSKYQFGINIKEVK